MMGDGKAVVLDGISPKLLHLGASTITPPLTYMCSPSIINEAYPNMWKTANKLHEFIKRQSSGQRKPISILPTMSKILECNMHTAFYRYLNNNNLLHHAQSGFRTLYSCETTLANIMNK